MAKLDITVERSQDVWKSTFKRYKGANPERLRITALQTLHSLISSFKDCLDNPKKTDITWERPYALLAYPIELSPNISDLGDQTGVAFGRLPTFTEELQDSKKASDTFRALSNGLAYSKKGDKLTLLVGPELYKKLSRLPEEKREAKLRSLRRIKPYIIPFWGRAKYKPGKMKKFRGNLVVRFHPMVIDQTSTQDRATAYYAYYPILVRFEKVKGYGPERWREEDRRDFWDIVLKNIKDQIPPEALGVKEEPLPEPTVEAVSPEEVKAPYAIVRRDRTTSQDLLPLLMHKGIFTKYRDLPKQEDILGEEKERLNKEELTFQETREALTRAREYTGGGFVFRDYGTYKIGFSSRLYIDFIKQTEGEIKSQLLTPTLFPDMDKNLEEALKKIRLYKLAHRLAGIILSEADMQRKYEDVIIPKEKLVKHYLNYTSEDKAIYQDIKEAMTSLRWVNYIFFDYNYTSRRKERKKAKGNAVGWFIYNLVENPKNYIVSINKAFVGCVEFLRPGISYKKKEKEDKLSRGYYSYPTRFFPLSKDYSSPAYLLGQFLLRERGNKRLKEKGYKVISYKLDRYIKEAQIHYKEKWKIFAELIDALRQVEIIEKTSPTIENLENLKPSQRASVKLRTWVKTPIKELDRVMELKLKNR